MGFTAALNLIWLPLEFSNFLWSHFFTNGTEEVVLSLSNSLDHISHLFGIKPMYFGPINAHANSFGKSRSEKNQKWWMKFFETDCIWKCLNWDLVLANLSTQDNCVVCGVQAEILWGTASSRIWTIFWFFKSPKRLSNMIGIMKVMN